MILAKESKARACPRNKRGCAHGAYTTSNAAIAVAYLAAARKNVLVLAARKRE